MWTRHCKTEDAGNSEKARRNVSASCSMHPLSTNLIGNNHEILDVLGQGGMGTVYAAKNIHTGRRVAIKSLHVRGAIEPDDPDLLRFAQEARIASALESPHINSALGVEIDPETNAPLLIMEQLEGEDLDSLISRLGALRVDTALRIAAQVCLGLKAAHGADVVHRDIKPGNLFLARQADGGVIVKILDFGIAKIRRLPPDSSARAGLTAPQVSLTATGQILGSPLYMAPEQVDTSKSIDARTDVFSLGKTLYTMLTGAPPHQLTRSLVKQLQQVLTEPPPAIGDVAPWVPPNVANVVFRATRIAPDERFADIAEFHKAISSCLSGGTELREDMLVAADKAEIPPIAPETKLESPPERQENEPRESLESIAIPMAKSHVPILILIVAGIIVFVVVAILWRWMNPGAGP